VRSAANREDGSEKHVAMENRLWPMRQLLGDLLLELKEPRQALQEFEKSLGDSRNRLRGFYGAAKAAEMANATAAKLLTSTASSWSSRRMRTRRGGKCSRRKHSSQRVE
jgi:hypothetical protein